MTLTAADPRSALLASRRVFAVAFIFSGFISLLTLTSPLYMMQIYNRVLPHRSEATLLGLTLLALALLGVMALLDVVRAQILVRAGNRLDAELSGRIAEAMFAAARTRARGGPEHGFRDLDVLRGFVGGTALAPFFDAPFAPLFVLLLFLFHPLLGTVALAGAVVLLMLAAANDLLTRPNLDAAKGHGAAALAFLGHGLRNSETIEAMGMFPDVRRRWAKWRNTMLHRQTIASDRAGAIMALSKMIRLWLQTAMLGAGAYLAVHDLISPGMIIASSVLMGRALAPVEQAIQTWKQALEAHGAYRRLNALLRRFPATAATAAAWYRPAGELIVEDLIVAPHEGEAPILQGVSFTLPPGKVLGIVGPSGAGKSSLARTLVGAWRPRAGTVRLGGTDIHALAPDARGAWIGYLPQEVELFEGTVADNIARLAEPERAAVLGAVERAGAHRMITALPEGYDTQVGPMDHVLSGGQRQQIGLARTLYGQPALVVLDEPNAHLDAEGETALAEVVTGLRAAGVTVVLISHSAGIIRQTDYLLVLMERTVRAFGPTERLALTPASHGSGPPARAFDDATTAMPRAGA